MHSYIFKAVGISWAVMGMVALMRTQATLTTVFPGYSMPEIVNDPVLFHRAQQAGNANIKYDPTAPDDPAFIILRLTGMCV